MANSNDDDPLLSDHGINTSCDESDDSCLEVPSSNYYVYPRRWVVLSIIMLLNISSGLMWMSFSPVADLTGKYFNVDANDVNWLSLVFPIATVPFGFVATWILDSFGLRFGIILASWINCIGGILRFLSTIETIHMSHFWVLLVGQSFCAIAQPFILFSPTKVAALWFPSKQRATANMMASMSNPLGILLANVFSPIILGSHDTNMPTLMWIYMIPGALGAILASVGICSSVPPTPPSDGAAGEPQSFTQGIKQIARSRSYWVLALCQGCGVATFTSLTTLLEQMLCPYGYTDTFAGICGALIIVAGIVGAAGAGAIVDRNHKFEEVAKIALSIGTVFLILFTILSRFVNMAAGIGVALALFGLFGFALYPVAMELGVECTYPVAEATSAGIQLIIGQILSIIMILVMQQLAQPLQAAAFPEQTCAPQQPKDYIYANLLLCCLASVGSVVFICFFKCEYRRLATERAKAAERILRKTEAALLS